MAINFCQDMQRLMGEHVSQCEQCRQELKNLAAIPPVKMLLSTLLPKDTYERFKQFLKGI